MRAEWILLILLSFFLFSAAFFFHLPWLIFICFLPFLMSIESAPNRRTAFFRGCLYGAFYFCFVLFWMINVSLVLFAASVLLEALYFGLFALGVHVFLKHKGAAGRRDFLTCLFVPALWTSLEYIRSVGFLGMPVGLAGYALSSILPLAQLASVTGIYGLSFFVLFINTLLFVSDVKNRALKERVFYLGSAVALLASVFLWGTALLNKEVSGETLRAAVIQADISGEEKWNEAFLHNTVEVHKQISLAVLKDKPDIIVWPETAIPCFLSHPQRQDILADVRDFAGKINTPLLAGTQRLDVDGNEKAAFNISILISGNGDITGEYAKIKLIPFIEQAPVRALIPVLRKAGLPSIFEPGREKVVFYAGRIPFSTLICFEGLFPGLVRKFVLNGAQVLFNLTNDAPSLGRMRFYYEQNARMLIMRAVENRRSVVRAANDGVSLFIDPYGRIIARTPPFLRGHLTAGVPVHDQMTSYTRFGDVIVWLSLAVTVFLLMWLMKVSGKKRE